MSRTHKLPPPNFRRDAKRMFGFLPFGSRAAPMRAAFTAVILIALVAAPLRTGPAQAQGPECRLIATPSTVTVARGGAATFGVKLNVSDTTTVNILNNGPTLVTAHPSSLSFSSDNWNVNQTVTVVGLNPSQTGNRTTTLTLITSLSSETDPCYDKTATVNVTLSAATATTTVTPTPTPTGQSLGSIVVNPSSLTISARGSGLIRVKLSAQPTGPVQLLALSNRIGLHVNVSIPGGFYEDNWNQPLTVAVTDFENPTSRIDAQVRFLVRGGGYRASSTVPVTILPAATATSTPTAPTPTATATNTPTATPTGPTPTATATSAPTATPTGPTPTRQAVRSIVVSPSSLTIPWRGVGTVTLSLSAPPPPGGYAAIRVVPSWVGLRVLVPGGRVHVFTSDNWNQPRTVTIRSIGSATRRIEAHLHFADEYDGYPSISIPVTILSAPTPTATPTGPTPTGTATPTPTATPTGPTPTPTATPTGPTPTPTATPTPAYSIVVNPINLTLRPGGGGTVAVKLSAPPTEDVRVVAVVQKVLSEIRRNPNERLFTPSNWATPQTFVIWSSSPSARPETSAVRFASYEGTDDRPYLRVTGLNYILVTVLSVPTQAPPPTPTSTSTPVNTPSDPPPSTPTPVNTPSDPPPTPTPVNTPSDPPPTPTPVNTPSDPPPTPTPVNTPSDPPPVNTPSDPSPTPTPLNTPTGEAVEEDVWVTNSLVKHAAAPAHVFQDGDTLLFYFAGPGGVRSGPVVPSISQLAQKYPKGSPVVTLFRGVNPLTGKEVRIDYLPGSEEILYTSAYLDKYYKRDKPYIFTIDKDGKVTHIAW